MEEEDGSTQLPSRLCIYVLIGDVGSSDGDELVLDSLVMGFEYVRCHGESGSYS